MDIALLNGIGREPVNSMRPAGSDTRDDTRFDALQAEIGKLSAPGSDGLTDWPRVAQLASNLLVDRGKDLLAAAYLNAALVHGNGLEGLNAGLQLIGDMIEHFWADMYPPLARVRARRNALQWMLDRVEIAAAEQQWSELPPQPASLIAELLAAGRRLDGLLRDRDEEAPSMRPLLALIDRVPVAEVAAAELGAAEIASGAGAAAPAPRAEASGSATSTAVFAPGALPADADQALTRVTEHLNPLADALMASSLQDARAFRISRFANWCSLETLPPASNGLTQIAAPIAEVVAVMERLREDAGDGQDAIRFAEAQLPAFPLWLDLQAVCAAGLARLGEEATPALREVERATRDLLERLPGVSQLCFANGMPFANGGTLEWAATLAAAGGQADGSRAALQASGDRLGPVMSQARTLAAEGDLEAAVSLLQRLISDAAEASAQLRARIALCQLLSSHREGRVPVPFAEVIVEQIRRHDLDCWDPALAVEGWVAAYGVLKQDGASASERNAALAAIARLDAKRAIALTS